MLRRLLPALLVAIALATPALAAAVITPVEPDNLRVFQRDPAATSLKVGAHRITLSVGTDYAFNGTYTGTAAGTPQVQVCSYSNDTLCNTVIVTWTNCGTFSGGVFSCSGANGITVPQGGWYKVQMRDGGATGTIYQAATPNEWAVGITVSLIGQSNNLVMWDCGTPNGSFTNAANSSACTTGSPGSPNATVSSFNFPTWIAPTGFGEIQLLNTLNNALGIPIGLCRAAANGSTIEQWQTNGSGSAYNNAYSGGNSCAGSHFGLDSEIFVWDQGEANCCINGSIDSGAAYTTAFGTLVSGFLSKVGRTAAQVAFLINPLGNVGYVAQGYTGATAATVDAIRQAQLAIIASYGAPVVAGCGKWDNVRYANGADVAHWYTNNGLGYIHCGARDAQAILNWENSGSYPNGAQGPAITGATYTGGGTVLKVKVAQHGGTGLQTETNGAVSSTGAFCCFRVFVGASQQTIASTTIASATEVDLTISGGTFTSAPKFDYLYGDLGSTGTTGIDNTSILLTDNQSVTGSPDSVGLPLQPTVGQLTATLPPVASVPLAGIVP